MIEGTPQLHANAWRVSSTCFAPVHVPMVDPCNINQQNSKSFFMCEEIPYITVILQNQRIRYASLSNLGYFFFKELQKMTILFTSSHSQLYLF